MCVRVRVRVCVCVCLCTKYCKCSSPQLYIHGYIEGHYIYFSSEYLSTKLSLVSLSALYILLNVLYLYIIYIMLWCHNVFATEVTITSTLYSNTYLSLSFLCSVSIKNCENVLLSFLLPHCADLSDYDYSVANCSQH